MYSSNCKGFKFLFDDYAHAMAMVASIHGDVGPMELTWHKVGTTNRAAKCSLKADKTLRVSTYLFRRFPFTDSEKLGYSTRSSLLPGGPHSLFSGPKTAPKTGQSVVRSSIRLSELSATVYKLPSWGWGMSDRGKVFTELDFVPLSNKKIE